LMTTRKVSMKNRRIMTRLSRDAVILSCVVDNRLLDPFNHPNVLCQCSNPMRPITEIMANSRRSIHDSSINLFDETADSLEKLFILCSLTITMPVRAIRRIFCWSNSLCHVLICGYLSPLFLIFNSNFAQPNCLTCEPKASLWEFKSHPFRAFLRNREN
jgi:hypothetical protein